MESDDFYFISGIPIIHSGLLREKFLYKKELAKVKKLLGNVNFLSVLIFATQNLVNSSKRTFNFMHYARNAIISKIIQKISPDIVYCRAYHASWAALKIREKTNANFKIVFDARVLWPQEQALIKNFDLNNNNYIFLKNIERPLLDKCDVTITVSDTMKSRFQEIGCKRLKNIYLSADTKKTCN